MELEQISALVAIAVAFITVIIAWKKLPVENRQGESHAAGEVSDAAIQLLTPLRERVEELEKETKAKNVEIAELKRRVEALERDIKTSETRLTYQKSVVQLYRDWNERLVEQLKQAGITPAELGNGGDKKS